MTYLFKASIYIFIVDVLTQSQMGGGVNGGGDPFPEYYRKHSSYMYNPPTESALTHAAIAAPSRSGL